MPNIHDEQTCHFCQSLRLAVATLQFALPGTAQLMHWTGVETAVAEKLLRDFLIAMEKMKE